MDLNDKIAARRREIEEASRKQVEAEQRLQRAELHRQQQAARMAKQQAARMAKQQEAEVKAQADAKAAESRFKPATPVKTVDIEGETELLNEREPLKTSPPDATAANATITA
jgi:septal ring factor EnvC (AmiA/AmiB activator)